MEKIENYIVENQLKAEDKPLSEQELCKMWGFNHCVILHSGMEKIGVTYTNKDESDLLMVGEEVPVFFREGTVYDENDEPVEYFKSGARSDYVYFASELKS